jgi:hypothetical protein
MRKKITAIIIAAVMILGLSACADTRYALTIDSQQIRAGEYIYLQILAAQEAAGKFMEENPDFAWEEGFDFFMQTVEGVPFGDWINNRAVENLTEIAAVRQMFAELELELSDEDELQVRRFTEEEWQQGSEFFEEKGIGKESLASIILGEFERSMVFFAIFGEGGTEAVEQEEINSHFEDNFVRFRAITMSFEGLGDAQIIELESMAEDFVTRLNAGESYLRLLYEYEDFVAGLESFYDFDVWDDAQWEDYHNEQFDEKIASGEEVYSDGMIQEEEIIEEDFIDHESLNDFDILQEIGAPPSHWEHLPEHVLDFLLTIPMNTADSYDDMDFVYILIPLPILEREDWLEWYRESLVVELREEEMERRIAAKADALNVVLNEAAIRRYKPENAVG